MLPFRTGARSSPRAAHYLGHAYQRRYIWALMALALLVILFGPTLSHKNKPPQPAGADGHLADNRIAPPPTDKAGPADRIIMPGELKVPDARPMLPIDGKRLFGGVSSKLFEVLEDDAVYRSAENDAFFKLLKTMKEADDADIEAASIGRLSFVQLYEQSHEYRGEIVTVGGKVLRLVPQASPPPNDQGIEKLYEVWFLPDRSRLPMVAVIAELPADYPGGQPEIDVSGFSYKRLGYASQAAASSADAERGMKDVFRSSPLILAKTIRVRPEVAVAQIGVRDEVPEALKNIPMPIPAKYVLPTIGIGMFMLCVLAGWAFKLSRTSVTSRGPIVGRGRDAAAAGDVEPRNLNSIRLDA